MRSGDSADDLQRGLLDSFPGYLGTSGNANVVLERASLIVLDANVLLGLYEIGGDARTEVMKALSRIRDRLWVPHQAALEFSRNRQRTVISRAAKYKDLRRSLMTAHDTAAETLHKQVAQLMALREKSRTAHEWDPATHKLDKESLRSMLDGVLQPALNELERLRAEQDVLPEDVFADDPFLREIHELLAGRIGAPFSQSELRAHVDAAIAFRYPNEIPPGAGDQGKPTDLLAAGDYLLWRQILDRSRTLPQGVQRSVILVTSEQKGDWWSPRGSRTRAHLPRPELEHELHEESGAFLILLSLADFMEHAQQEQGIGVSGTTIDELRKAAEALNDAPPRPTEPLILSSIKPAEFINLVAQLILTMGFRRAIFLDSDGSERLVVPGSEEDGEDAIVRVSFKDTGVRPTDVEQFIDHANAKNATATHFYVTSGHFGFRTKLIMRGARVTLIDGGQFASLLREHLDMSVMVDYPIP